MHTIKKLGTYVLSGGPLKKQSKINGPRRSLLKVLPIIRKDQKLYNPISAVDNNSHIDKLHMQKKTNQQPKSN